MIHLMNMLWVELSDEMNRVKMKAKVTLNFERL